MKPEIIDPTLYSNVHIALIEAMTLAYKPNDPRFEEIFVKQSPEPGKVNVVVTVNGEQVPFVEALGQAVDRMVADFDKVVLEKAQELIAKSPAMSRMYSRIQQLENSLDATAYEIEEELKKVRGW